VKAKHNLEHVVFNSWTKKNPNSFQGKILVSVSGGRDSMALLSALQACFPSDRLVVIHCHHGDNDNKVHRDEAENLVADYCAKNGVECDIYKSEADLKSEADYRSFRLTCLQNSAEQHGTDIVCLAHHLDDWLETQLIKLIRGSSFASLRKSFQWSRLETRKLTLWRPFSNQKREAIDVYRQGRGIPFVDDPSNRDTKYFRNWLRNDWLPRLEKTRPGAVKRLAKSLISSLSELKPQATEFPWDFKTNSIDFIYFLSLAESEKLRCLAYFVSSKGISSIKASQLKEIIRQLDKDSDRYHIKFKTFECLVNAGQLVISLRG
tara:strand:+ start:85526 stop:86485 length:960 start_codon:yes stop_codon:yes gene_type:complete